MVRRRLGYEDELATMGRPRSRNRARVSGDHAHGVYSVTGVGLQHQPEIGNDWAFDPLGVARKPAVIERVPAEDQSLSPLPLYQLVGPVADEVVGIRPVLPMTLHRPSRQRISDRMSQQVGQIGRRLLQTHLQG